MKILALFACFSLILSEIAGQNPEIKIFKNLPADPEPQKNQYTLFSLATGKLVPEAEFSSDKWDLGFKGTAIIINGGEGRQGRGAADIVEADFDSIDKLPDGISWATDGPGDKTAIPSGSGNGWYEYVFTTHEIRPLPGRTILLRTATGRYAKVEILSYYRDIEGETDSPGRYYTFRYVYQSDGTEIFK